MSPWASRRLFPRPIACHRVLEVWVIENVEKVTLELECEMLCDFKLLRKAHVEIGKAWPDQTVSSKWAVTKQSEIHAGRTSVIREQARIEVAVGGALLC